MAAFPGLFTGEDPKECLLERSRQKPSGDAWFGYDLQGCDIYARTIHGARASIVVGTLAALIVTIVGLTFGMLAGFYGGWIDTILSRVTDIFFGIPFLLGAIIVLTSFPSGDSRSFWLPVSKVVIALAVLGWTNIARIMRAQVLQVKEADYVTRRPRARCVHLADPARARPAERDPAGDRLRDDPARRLHRRPRRRCPTSASACSRRRCPGASTSATPRSTSGPRRTCCSSPSLFLSVTVLAFIMLGDAVRDALDPKQR